MADLPAARRADGQGASPLSDLSPALLPEGLRDRLPPEAEALGRMRAAVLGANYPGSKWYDRAFRLMDRNAPWTTQDIASN